MSYCPKCGAGVESGSAVCAGCGRPVFGDAPAAQLASVAIVCGLFSYIFWSLLALPGRLVALIVPWVDCSTNPLGSPSMFGCSFFYAFTRILGPLALTVALVVMRRRFRQGATTLLHKLPQRYRFLGPPLAATAVFGLTWSWAHATTASFYGVLPQRVFPMVAGLFCFLGLRYTAAFQERYQDLLERRDRLSRPLRVAIAVAIPLLVAIAITGTLTDQDKAYKEQLVTVLGLVSGYAALVPRKRSVPASTRS